MGMIIDPYRVVTAVEMTYGTMAEASQGLNGTSNANHGLKFLNVYAGTVTQAKMGKGQAGQNQTAKIYTDNAGSPGTQVGGNSDPVAENGSSDHTFTWSSNAPVLSANTTYWLVTTRAASTSTIDTCTEVVGQVTGGHGTITSITDGGNVTAGRDLRMGVTVTP